LDQGGPKHLAIHHENLLFPHNEAVEKELSRMAFRSLGFVTGKPPWRGT
jgi:hypothetical protein